MGSGKKTTIGYKYLMGMHMILCHGPVDKMSRIDVGEREAWAGELTASGQLSINKPELFGGEQKEGGIVGKVDIMFGGAGQMPNDYLVSVLGAIMPAFRGVVSAVLRKVYLCAMSPYPKPWAFLITRVPKAWYPEKATIDGSNPVGGSANAAHIIYETLTHPDWGMGYSEGALDLTTFQEFADTLYDEGFGLSFALVSTDSIESFIYSVLTHVNGLLYSDPVTGKFAIKLLRYDYDIDELPVYDEDNIVALDNYERPAFGEMVNEIVVSYRPKGGRDDATVTLQDLASVQAQEGIISQTVNYPGIDNADNASRVAMRDVRQKSTPLARVKLRVNRDAWNITIGKCFRFSWAEHNVDSLVVRVLGLNYGDLNDQTIIVDGVEDVFGLPEATYLKEQPSLWTNPVQTPGSVSPRKVYEATYWDLARGLDTANFEALEVTSTFVTAVGGAPVYAAPNYELWTHPGSSSFVKADSEAFCPHGLLTAQVNRTATTLNISFGAGDFTNFPTGGYCVVDNEIIRVDSINTTTGDVVVGRGCLDTVPAPHSNGAVVLFAMGYVAADPTEYAVGETVAAKLLTRTPAGLLAQGSAPTDSLTTVGRQGRPYPPGNLRVNGLSYPSAVSDAMTITWAHRDRTQQLATIVDHTASNIGPEPGTTYSARILRTSDNAVLAAVSGLSGTTWSPAVYFDGGYTVEVWSVRDGLLSMQKATHSFTMALSAAVGWDYNWDANWGYGPAYPQITTVSLSGGVDVGAVVRATLGGAAFNYTIGSGNTLADIATGLAAVIDASTDYVASAVGAVVTVTGQPRIAYTATAELRPVVAYMDASSGITQTAAPVRAGNRQVLFFYWGGTPSTKPIGYYLTVRKSNAVVGQPDTIYLGARKTAYIGDHTTGHDVDLALMFGGGDAGSPGDYGINYLANEADVDIYCVERDTTWPSDWCEGWDTVSTLFDAAIVFPVGEVSDIRYNLGVPVSPPQPPGTWQSYGNTSPGDDSQPSTSPFHYFDPGVTFGFYRGANHEDRVDVARPQISTLNFQRVLGEGVVTRVIINGTTYSYTGTSGQTTEDVIDALAGVVNAAAIAVTAVETDGKLVLTGAANVPFTAIGSSNGVITTVVGYSITQPAA